MAKTVELNKKTGKKYLPVKLNDGDEVIGLMLLPPTKKIMDRFIAVNDISNDDDAAVDGFSDLYEICKVILNHNKGGVKLSQDKVDELLDVADIGVLFESYSDFIAEAFASKN